MLNYMMVLIKGERDLALAGIVIALVSSHDIMVLTSYGTL